MTRVLLGHSYFLRFDDKLWRAMQPYPPLGTLYAAALLRQRGHDVRVFDAMLATSTAEWEAMLDAETPEVAVMFEDNFNYLSKMCLLRMREAAFQMVAAARARGCRVIVCGADVTDHASDYLQRGADFAVIGEGEETVCDLLEALSDGRQDFDRIPGIAYQREGAEVATGRRSNITDPDTLPAPAYDLIDIERYRSVWRQHNGRFSLNLVSSRGCPFHCNWCAKPIWGQRYSVHSPEAIVEQVRTVRSLGAEHVWFMDDILGLKPGWLDEFADRLEAEGLVTPFNCLARADLLLRPGEIEALRRAGCEMVWIGAESGSQQVLDAMEKGTTVDQAREAAAQLRGAGIKVAFFLQFGYPGETWQDIQATLQLVRDADPDDIGVSVSYPLPGTPFYARVREHMSGRHNWIDSDDMAMLYDGPYPTSFYRRLYDTLHAEFRIQKTRAGRSLAESAASLASRGDLRRGLTFAKDLTLLPLLRARLELARRRAPQNQAALPGLLSRREAATPSAQEPRVGAPSGRP